MLSVFESPEQIARGATVPTIDQTTLDLRPGNEIGAITSRFPPERKAASAGPGPRPGRHERDQLARTQSDPAGRSRVREVSPLARDSVHAAR